MRRLNKHSFFIYEKCPIKVDGESSIKWKYKDTLYLNDQQDLNELDRNSSGVVDNDTLKLRIRQRTEVNISKTDGISYKELSIDEYGMVLNDEKPEYTVESTNKIGKSNLFVCKTYNGE